MPPPPPLSVLPQQAQEPTTSDSKTDAEKKSADDETNPIEMIADPQAAEGGPRGNVHSEEEDGPELPDVPPMPV